MDTGSRRNTFLVPRVIAPSNSTTTSHNSTPTRSSSATGSYHTTVTNKPSTHTPSISGRLARSASSSKSSTTHGGVKRRIVTPSISVTRPSFEAENGEGDVERGGSSRVSSLRTPPVRFISDGSTDTVIHRPITPKLVTRRPSRAKSNTNSNTQLPHSAQEASQPTITNITPSSTSPTLADAFFRMHWTHLSALALQHDWLPAEYFQPQNSRLLDPEKCPSLASSVRDVFYVYGEVHAWELAPHVFFPRQSGLLAADDTIVGEERGEGSTGAKIAWSHARREELMRDRKVWKEILARGKERGFDTQTVILALGGSREAGFARVCDVEDDGGWEVADVDVEDGLGEEEQEGETGSRSGAVKMGKGRPVMVRMMVMSLGVSMSLVRGVR